MHAYLLITREGISEAKVREIVPDVKVIIPFALEKITDTKELIRQTGISFPSKTAFLLNNFDKASIEAQNAFLKSLEEAQENVVYVLSAGREEKVLPTIASRCQIVRAKEPESRRVKVNTSMKIDFETISKITKREEAVEYLEGLIGFFEPKLPDNALVVKAADEALTRIKANANPTLQLTWFVTQVGLR